MHPYIIDIETRPDEALVDIFNAGIKPPANYKTDEAKEKYIKKQKEASHKKMATNPHFCKIICVGVLDVENPEKKCVLTLEEFGQFLDRLLNRPKDGGRLEVHDPVELIGYNSKNFDIPALVNGFAKNPKLTSVGSFIALRDCMKFKQEFQQIKHTDLMLDLNRYGDFTSLDTLMQVYLGIEKNTKDDDFFKTATDEEIKQHCLEDLEYTNKLYKLFYR